MPRLLRKFALLLWKNLLVLRRRRCVAIFEIIFVALTIGVFYLLRSVSKFQHANVNQEAETPGRNGLNVCPSGDTRQYFAYSPASSLVREITAGICNKADKVDILEFETKAELSKKIETDKQFVKNLTLAVAFSDNLRGVSASTDVPEEVEVTIGLVSKGDSWYTDRLYSYAQDPELEVHRPRQFFVLQDRVIIGLLNDGFVNDTMREQQQIVSYQPFPESKKMVDQLYSPRNVLEKILYVFFFFFFLYYYLITIKTIGVEKESQLKESMKIMGLPGWLQWFCWFLQVQILFSISIIILICAIIYMKPSIIAYSDGFVLYLFLSLYACSIIAFAFLVSTLFAKANTSVMVGCIAFGLLCIPYAMLAGSPEKKGPPYLTVLLSSLLCSSGLGFGLQIIFKFERIQEGVNWENRGTVLLPFNVSLENIMWMFVVDTILYMCLALYIDKLCPGQYGVPLPFYFPCLPSYWGFRSKQQDVEQPSRSNQKSFEQITDHRPIGIQLMNLSKSFRSHQAVKNLTLEMYQGHLTVLVGHNGAGKTTTLNMITGMIPPSAGTVYVNGYDVRRSPGKVRDSMGLCLEHNVLIDELTVTEHLQFFGRLKGLSKKEVQREIDMYLKVLQLEDKRKSRPSKLSGGMKRKLCVAIALCGKSKVVVLDEPTKGMDPSSRRDVWDLLQKVKGERTVLLTTHFMDEADILGDRVAIMASGEVQCCGSSFFLKQQYNTGYYLVLDVTPRCQPDRITGLLKSNIPTVKIHSYVGSELKYHMPGSESPKFETMLSKLEDNLQSLEIRSFGVSMATLEDVFMKVGTDTENLNKNQEGKKQKEKNEPPDEYMSGVFFILNQVFAMFLKRCLCALRQWPMLLLQIFLPGLTLLIGVALLHHASELEENWPSLKLTLNSYSSPVTLLSGEKDQDAYRMYKEMVERQGHKVVEVDDIRKEILKQERSLGNNLKEHYILGASFTSGTSTAWFNHYALHSAPLSYSLVLNALYHTSVSFVNHPLPETGNAQSSGSELFTLLQRLGVVQLFMFALIVAASLFVIFCINEQSSGNKYLQLVSGVNVLVFWLTSFLFDLIVFFLMLSIIVIITVAADFDMFNSLLGCLVDLFISFFFFCLTFIYLLSTMLNTPSYGFTCLFVYGVLTGIVGAMLALVFAISAEAVVHTILIITSPFGSLGAGVIALAVQQFSSARCDRNDPSSCKSYPQCCDIDNCYAKTAQRIGNNILYAYIMSGVLFVLLFVHEYGLFSYLINKLCGRHKLPAPPADVDNDVQAETNKIRGTPKNTLYNSNVLVLNDLTKYYRRFPAVKGLCLAVKSNECFGLIGENGAGKTTTFKMITGETAISYGDAVINSLSIRRKKKTVQKQIGYCPQFDALLDYLTPRETLRIFALIRGVSWTNSQPLAENLAAEFDFSKYLDKQIKALSFGNKRKVSASLAVLANPSLIYLDEPSSGMDPSAKRYLWSSLIKLRDGGKCIIFTSQSMEEAEALCTRVTIMVNGSFQCLGSTQMLKNKFAQASSLKIKVKKPVNEDKITAIDNFVKKNFPKVQLLERFQELLSYEIGSSMPWSRMFGIMEKNMSSLGIEEYSLGQCSLEQVFLNFVKHQK